ncbi:uncharacterized protein LOC134674138 [Cydia fagiglandana]|uniref:uncharacterized protein LOC134674138 n=1 Tax=Cydia fagiglandana TaxID=1458189 RepID=UPI002FEE2C61
MKINKRIHTECLLNNIVDQHFQAMMFPLNLVQSCFLMPRFSIINNFITPDNHVSFYIQSIIGCTIQTMFLGMFVVILNLKNFLLLVTLSIACENFYTTINLAESCCAQILSNAISTGMRKTCKNVLRLNLASLRKMSAFGVFEFDATFPLRLFSVIVVHTVVLLQFAFLT